MVIHLWKPSLYILRHCSYARHEDYGYLPSYNGKGQPSSSSSLGANLSFLFIKKPILTLSYEN